MNNRQFETLLHWTTRRVSKYGYIINCWNNRRTALTRYLQGLIMGAVELVLRQDLPESFVAKCATGGKMMILCRLIYRFTVNKMILKYQSGRKRTNEHETGERGELWGPQQILNQMIFYVQYEHMMVRTDGETLPDSRQKRLEAEGRRASGSAGLRGPPPVGTCQKISPDGR